LEEVHVVAAESNDDDPAPHWITVKGLVLPSAIQAPIRDRAAALEQLRRLLEDRSLSPEARSFIEECLRSASPPAA
jgi:hypothetical protein